MSKSVVLTTKTNEVLTKTFRILYKRIGRDAINRVYTFCNKSDAESKIRSMGFDEKVMWEDVSSIIALKKFFSDDETLTSFFVILDSCCFLATFDNSVFLIKKD
jgi:hypothetical protein